MMKKAWLLSVALMLCVLLTACGGDSKNEIAYQEGMAAAVKASPDEITGNKAITVIHEKDEEDAEGTYSDVYVPEEYKTDKPAEVRYLIICNKGSEFAGTYIGTGCSAVKHKYTVELKDLKSGTSVENVFYGGEPPQSIYVEQGEVKQFFGSEPSEEVITEWVLTNLQEWSKPEATEEVEVEEELEEDPIAAGYDSEEEMKEMEGEQEFVDSKEAALEQAKELISLDIGYSPSELEHTLVEYDGFSKENAKYAVKNCGADWKEEAVKCARMYDENGFGFSYDSLYYALKENHKFTEEEAQYALEHCGNDWNKAAVDYVAFMLEYGEKKYTRDEMIQEMVEFAGFTKEQAIYGVDQNNLK